MSGSIVVKKVARWLYHSIPSPRVRDALVAAAAKPFRSKIVRRNLGGYQAELHLGESMELAAYFGSFERDMVDLIDRLTKPGMIALDIGANVGLHTLRIAHRVAPNGLVYAFEPTEYAFRKLCRNAALNPNLKIEALRLALSNEGATDVEIHFRSSWLADGGRADTETSKVDFVRLDDWINRRGIERVDFIKMDIDGHEGFVLQGAVKTIERDRPDMLVEASIYQYEDGRPDAFALLAGLGYKLFTTSEGEEISHEAIPVRLAALPEGVVSINIYACAPSIERGERP